ncbi:hypothetical protein ASD97_14645 [Streptomyces sp. Root63]|uniref:hypothetical protein n=1 Tax=unclassified Streptomyces TaxID=2593676 RepID=UPI0006FDC72D|nr:MULTISPECIES: hypothetical protein [unclassified Streptomyces]KQX31037.1 hypothetical protein ASD29_19815 [Streptomyces sp. Root1295]KRA40976.1 hypothetical protein ASD97_14645 [Streptomyces sp. Root63]
MKQQRSSEESEPGNGRDAASGETAPDSAQGSGPGSIGAPSAPASRTATQGGDTSVAGDGDGGGARTPTSSAPGPEEPGEREAGAPAAVHAVGVSIGRTTAGAEEQPEGSDAAAAREEAAETAGGSTVAAAAGAVPAAEATTANSAEETAEAKTVAPAGAEAAAATETAATESGATKTGSASQEAAGTAGAATAETAEAAASGATSTATTTATATVAASPPDSASATEGGAPERPGRVSRPMVVAAAFAGALLLGAPFVVAGAQKDDGKPTRGEAAAAAWKQDGQEGGYVPGTDPAGPDGVRAPGSPQQGAAPVRGDKGPANHVRGGDGPQRANGSPETERGDGAKGSTGTGGTTDKNGSSAKAPAGTGSEGSAKAPSAETAPQSQPQTTPKAPTVVYSGVSGHECPTQRFQRDGYYSDGKEGWATHSGGFGGYGCAGKYLSMPMSGSSSKDSGGSATWLFDLPASAKKCSISVHVPGSSDIVRVGGDPSYYTVYDRFLPRTNNLVGSFYVNQQDRRGTWYNVPGTFAVDAKKLSVRIHDRGRDSKYEHHAISTIKATCTG